MNRALSDHALDLLLQEDCPYGDLTTENLLIGDKAARLTFSARHPMTVCGSEEAVRLFELAGARAVFHVESGHEVVAGKVLLEAQGTLNALHKAWKISQNLMESASGIASAAHAIVTRLRDAGFVVPVAATRKNFPGTKALAVKAIKAGGASMHRMGLSETLLLFPEHQRFLESSPTQTIKNLRSRLPEKKIIVEVKDIEAALVWSQAGADVLQLEKFSPSAVKDCLNQIAVLRGAERPTIAVAGGVHLHNALEYASAGAEVLVTSAPYAAAPSEVQVAFME